MGNAVAENYILTFAKIKTADFHKWVGWFVMIYGISNLVSYLIPNPIYSYIDILDMIFKRKASR